jgi:hypothetical protein
LQDDTFLFCASFELPVLHIVLVLFFTIPFGVIPLDLALPSRPAPSPWSENAKIHVA